MSRYSEMTYKELLSDHFRQMKNLNALRPILKKDGLSVAVDILDDERAYVEELYSRLEKYARRWMKNGKSAV